MIQTSTPLLQKSAPCSGGRRWRAASACRWAFSPRPSISLMCAPRAASGGNRVEPGAGSARPLAARLRLRHVKKNRELTVTGPYAYTRNPLYLGSMLMAAGFALALLSWPLALVLAVGFAVDLRPRHRRRGAFSPRRVSRLRCLLPPRSAPDSPRLTPATLPAAKGRSGYPGRRSAGGFSFALYLQHREYNAAIGAALLYLSLLYLRPAAGSNPAPAAVSFSAVVQQRSIHKEPCPTLKTRANAVRTLLRSCPGGRGSRPAGRSRLRRRAPASAFRRSRPSPMRWTGASFPPARLSSTLRPTATASASTPAPTPAAPST